MNQYKFRGKRKDNGVWVYGSLTVEYDGTCHINYWVSKLTEPENNFWEMVHEMHEVIAETVGMWTGWNDKHGNEIYQGDKLRGMMGEQESENRSPITSTVLFKEGGFEVFTKPMVRFILGRFCWVDPGFHGRRDVYRVIEEIEVVGNIHVVKPAVKDSVTNTMSNINSSDPGTQQEEVKAEGEVTTDQVSATEQEAQENAMESAEEGTTEG